MTIITYVLYRQINLIIYSSNILQANEVYIAIYVQMVLQFQFCCGVLSMHLRSPPQPVLIHILMAQTISPSVICTLATLVASCLVLEFTAYAASSCSFWCHRCPQTVLVSCWDSLSHCNHSHAIQAWHTWMKRQLNMSLCSGFVSKCWGWR